MHYYSSFGQAHDHSLLGGNLPTSESVVSQEDLDPNSTIDADRMISTIGSLVDGKGSKRLIDVGSGYGFFTREAMKYGFDVVSLELAETERKIAKEITGISPIESSFEAFHCEPSSCSVVLMSQILEHAMDINLWVAKAHTILERNGIVAIALPNFGSIFRIVMQEDEPYICPPTHLNFFNPYSLSKLLQKHGFSVESTQWVSRIPKRSFERRMPSIARPMLPVVDLLSGYVLKTIDYLHLGVMINVYGRKNLD